MPWEQLLLQSSVGGLGVWEDVLEEVMANVQDRLELGGGWVKGEGKGSKAWEMSLKVIGMEGLGCGREVAWFPRGTLWVTVRSSDRATCPRGAPACFR